MQNKPYHELGPGCLWKCYDSHVWAHGLTFESQPVRLQDRVVMIVKISMDDPGLMYVMLCDNDSSNVYRVWLDRVPVKQKLSQSGQHMCVMSRS